MRNIQSRSANRITKREGLRATREVLCVASTLALSINAGFAGGVVLDGKFGTTGALSGPNYTISASMGAVRGNNLFHSFSQFDLSQGDVATFTGPANIQNILARVTGSNPSSINGTIQSDIAGANFFLINPHGIIFGPNASINVSGSFAATSANYLKLADGARFVASLDADDSVLSTAPVSAFGFLGNNGSISVQQSTLQVPDGKTITFAGGDISLDGAAVKSAGGQINVVSVQSAGEVPLDPGTLSATDFQSTFPQTGQIQMQNGAVLDASGDGGGRIVIRGGSLTVDNSQILANTTGASDGQGIDIAIANDLNVINNGEIVSLSTLGEGAGGNININAGSIVLSDSNGDADSLGNPSTQISTGTSGGTGKGGDISIQTGSLQMAGMTQISSDTSGAGDAGKIQINASSINMDAQLFFIARISASQSDSSGAGRAGDMDIQVNDLEMFNGAQILASTIGTGQAGQVNVTADTIALNSASYITASSSGSGNGGDVNVTATTSLKINGSVPSFGMDFPTGIQALAQEDGSGGNIQVTAGSLDMEHLGSIATSTFSSGAGGNIQVNTTGNLTLGTGANINALGADIGNGVGPAGTVSVHSGGSILLTGNSSIDTSAPASSGGDINVSAGSDIDLINSQIAASAGLNGGNITVSSPTTIYLLNSSFNAQADSTASGFGNGGNLTIDPSFLILNRSSLISKSSLGNGGNISILSDFFFTSGSLIDASAPFGLPGTVSVTAPKVDLSGSLIGLPGNLLDAEAQLRPDCGVRQTEDISSFVVLGRGSLPLKPGGFVPSGAVPLHAEKK